MEPARARRLAAGLRLAAAGAELRADLSDTERLLLRALVEEQVEHVSRVAPTDSDDLVALLPTERGLTAQHARRGVRRVVGRGLWPYRAAVAVLAVDAGIVWAAPAGAAKDDGGLTVAALLVAAVAVVLVASARLPRVLVTQLGSRGGSLLRRAATIGEHVEDLLRADVASASDVGTTDSPLLPRSPLLASVRQETRRRVVALAGSLAVLAVVTFLGLVRALGLL